MTARLGPDDILARCDFPSPDAGRVFLAVSGGADSLALLVLAATAGLDAVAIHVDHGLRDGSAAEADLVAEVAAAYRVGFERRAVRVEPGSNLESRARRARYETLPRGVLTGHTMDDQAETVLLNVLRGAALDGLAGIRPDTGRVRHPLLHLRRAETSALCRDLGLPVVSDPSNEDPRFRRNRVRSEVLPLLSEVAGRDLVPVLSRQAALLAADADWLEEMASTVDATDAGALRSAPEVLARRAVRAWLRSPPGLGDVEWHPPSSDEVARVLHVAAGYVKACELEGGRRVERTGGRLRVTVGSADRVVG